jgi:oligopeptide transport system ATP-binding protein
MGKDLSKMNSILEVTDLKKHYPIHGGILARQIATVKAVDGVSFTLKDGETLGLVGESGCGKSTTGKCIIGLETPTTGKVLLHTKNADHPIDLAPLNRNQMRPYRKNIQMIFQDPYSSLNPRMTCGDIIAEPMEIQRMETAQWRYDRVAWLLDKVGLSADKARRYPHEFSGGQRQRIGLARALAVNPSIVIADEPVSALDVSIQAQVINLLQDLQEEFGLSYIFIAHDLSVVEHISNRVAVMYLGNMVELAPSDDLYSKPLHPYTQALMSAAPTPDPRAKEKKNRIILEGDVPSPMNKPSGCGFRTRCRMATDECANIIPEFKEIKPGHFVACIHVS